MTVKELTTNNMGYTPYKMKASGHNNSPIEKNYGSKSDRGFGVPFAGGVGSREDRTGVADAINPSPNKGWFKNMVSKVKKGAKKVGGALGGAVGGALGLAKKGGGGEGGGSGGKIKAMDDRISALEEGMSGGGEGEVPATDPVTGMTIGGVGGELSTTDPMYGGGGDSIANKAMMGHKAAMAMAGGGGSDPMMLAAGGLGGSSMREMVKKKKMKEGWGGIGEAQAV